MSNETLEWRKPDESLKEEQYVSQQILVVIKSTGDVYEASYGGYSPKGKPICMIRGAGEEYYALNQISWWCPMPKGPPKTQAQEEKSKRMELLMRWAGERAMGVKQ